MKDNKNEKNENHKKAVEKIKKKAIERGEKQSHESEQKIRLALMLKPLPYTELLKATKLSSKAFRKHRKKMVSTGEVKYLPVEGKKRGLYALSSLTPSESLEFFAIKVLGKFLRKELTDKFNRYLGSLVTYTLTTYPSEEALRILASVFLEIESYVKPKEPKADFRLKLIGTPAPVYDLTSPEWAVWKAVNSQEYVTIIGNERSFNSPKFEKDWATKP